MFGRSYASQTSIGNVLGRVAGLGDALMTALPRVGGLEMQHTKTNQTLSVLESKLDWELQRRRFQIGFEGSAAGTKTSQKPAAGAQPLPSHRGVGALPQPTRPTAMPANRKGVFLRSGFPFGQRGDRARGSHHPTAS